MSHLLNIQSKHDQKSRLKLSGQVNILSSSLTGNSTNYYLILGPRDKAAPPTSQQIKRFPPKRMKNLATPSSIFIFISSSSTGEFCSQPIGRMFPEHVEQSFLDPEYSFVTVRRILPTRFAKQRFAQSRTN